MGRRKLDKFADNERRRNVIQPGKSIYDQIKGKWRKDFFMNDQPLVLELACGRGEYTIGLSRVFTDRNFIGVDIKGARIWRGSKIAEEEGLVNAAFLRAHIQNLDNFFENCEVDEIWITFPDPRPKDSDERRRLTNPRFIDLYRKIMKPGGKIHLKTDNKDLFDYSLDTVSALPGITDLVFTYDLYDSPLLEEHHGIQTTYELGYLEEKKKINYLRFKIHPKG